MTMIAYIVLGFIVGLIGRATLPAPRQVGFYGTLLLGMVGAIVGGIVHAVLDPGSSLSEPHPMGFLLAAIGAVVVMVTVTVITRRRVHA